jgi:hypothetical protein
LISSFCFWFDPSCPCPEYGSFLSPKKKQGHISRALSMKNTWRFFISKSGGWDAGFDNYFKKYAKNIYI